MGDTVKKIPLTQGKFALVDDEDFEFINQWKWFYLLGRARRSVTVDKKQYCLFMHTVIMGGVKGVDHINGNALDNRKINLRICTPAENSWNRKVHKNNQSGFKGVVRRKRKNGYAYRVVIFKDGKQINIGTYSSVSEAREAYKSAAIKYFGEFARW
jgi:hypothetical protein